MPLTPAQRSIRARVAAYAMHATGGTSTKAATTAFLSRFERQVDPDGTLPPEERSRRAMFARKAYMGGLALRSSRSRRSDKAAGSSIAAAPAMKSEASDVPTRRRLRPAP